MRRGRFVLGATTLLVAVIAGLTASAALAASPRDICKDLKDGKVDGKYTPAEWTAFFNDPTVQGYGCKGIPPNSKSPSITQRGGGPKTPARSSVPLTTTTKTRGHLPFTGTELGIFAVVGFALVGTGLL